MKLPRRSTLFLFAVAFLLPLYLGGGCASSPTAVGWGEKAAGALQTFGQHAQAAGAMIAPAAPMLGAALLIGGGGLSSLGTAAGFILAKRRVMWGTIRDRRQTPAPPGPRSPWTDEQRATVAAALGGAVNSADVARILPAQGAGTPELASPKAKRKRARRRGAPAPFHARIAPAGGQQTSGRAAA